MGSGNLLPVGRKAPAPLIFGLVLAPTVTVSQMPGSVQLTFGTSRGPHCLWHHSTWYAALWQSAPVEVDAGAAEAADQRHVSVDLRAAV